MLRKTVTLVFCDVADSTPLGERLDPEALRGVWSRYHETAREVLERHGGTIEKFVGDAVMAVFGIPVVHEDDALRAVRAAVELRGELARLNDELERGYGVRIDVRTGINTGEVFAGDPAQGDPFATGDAVVVAQRLEASAAGGEILVGDATMRLVRDAVDAEAVGALTLKGKSDPVDAWRLLDIEPEAAGVARRMDSPLVGRTAELAQLRAELERAAVERTCCVVTILGEPGVGKSRLAAELAASVGNAFALEGRCLPYGNGVTYWPLVEILRRIDLDSVLADEPDREAIHGRVLEAVGLAEPRSRTDELYWAIRRLLETLAREQPLLLVLDDVQWAEPAFLDLIDYLAGWSRDAPILICCLARPDLAETRPALAGVTLRLAPLEREESLALLENLAGPLDPKAAEAVGRATGGNPLFLEEMLRMLVEDGLLVEREGRLQALAAVESMPVPETVQAVLAARLDRLEEEELAVLQRAAVIGQVFWWGAVADLSPPERAAEVSGHLHALVRKGLVRPDRRTFVGEDGFRFGHILIRDAAYESMPKRVRGELHERFANWVEARGGERVDLDEILGHHLEQAHAYRVELGPADEAARTLAARAVERLARAGRRALARADAHAAANLLGRAAALDAEPNEILLELATARRETDDLAGSLETLDQILGSSPPPRVEWSARLERAFVLIYLGQGSTDDVLSTAEAAAGVFAELGDERGLASTWNAVGVELFWRGLTAQMGEAFARGLEHARRAQDDRRELSALNGLSIALALGPTPADEAAARIRANLARLEELGPAALVTAVLAGVEAMCGRIEEAWRLYEHARSLLGEPGSRIGGAGLLLYAEALLALDPKRAVEELRPAYEALQGLGEKGVLPTVAAFLAEALLAQGDVVEAEELTRVAEHTAVAEDVYSKVVGKRVRARVLALRGEDGGALAQEAVEIARGAESPQLLAGALVALAQVEQALGGTGEAELLEALALYEAKRNLPARDQVHAVLDRRVQTR